MYVNIFVQCLVLTNVNKSVLRVRHSSLGY